MKKLLTIIIIIGMTGHLSAAECESSPKRIISLAPNMTEILFSLGLGENVVGVTSFCDYPEEARAKTKIGGMSNPSLEAIVSLKPDLVVMTTDGNPREVEERLRTLGIRTYVFKARRLAELPRGIREMGTALGVGEQAETLARKIENALKGHQEAGTSQRKRNLERRTPNSELNKTKVLFIVWPEPLIVAGPATAMDDAMTLLGYENIAAKAKSSYPKYSLEEVIREAPETLFIGKGSGMDMRTVSHGILKRLSSVPAVRNGSVCYVSDSLYRLGPRVIKGIEELAACQK